MEQIRYEKGIVFRGNTERIRRVLKKAEEGSKVTVGFLGGSITQGSLAARPEYCYVSRVADWWKKMYPSAEIICVNAGIGGTTSQFGAARVEEDLLQYQPDFVVIEFSVNDENTLFFRETYEGLVRKVYGADSAPAVVLVHNVFYNSGENAEEQHALIGRHYDIPCLSVKAMIYPMVADGRIPAREITPDDLHPNDAGHEILANMITCFLEDVCAKMKSGKTETNDVEMQLPEPLTANTYENAVRYQNYNSTPELSGFVADTEEQQGITDVFKRGFIGMKKGDRISFTIEGTEIAVQYRKSVKHPACVAKAVLDGNEEKAVILDGNFEETWGDCLYITTLAHHAEKKLHHIEITITGGDETMVPFYLVSVIAGY